VSRLFDNYGLSCGNNGGAHDAVMT
jgi:hypothetical protein